MTCAAISRVVAVAVGMLLAGEAHSQSIPLSPQQPPPQPPRQPQDKSLYLGTPVAHPEELSGIWEAPDGHGGAIGIHLVLDTTVPVDATTLVGVPQSWLGLQVGLYRRTGAALPPGEENFFSDSLRGGSVHYEEGRLTLHAPRHDLGHDLGNDPRYDLGYDLDLHRIPGDKWSGRFHRADFDAVVTLERPTLESASNAPWFLGTWKSAAAPETTCLHIAQQSPTAFIAWADTLRTWGSAKLSAQAVKPPYSAEHYGDLVKVEPAGNGTLSIELGVYSTSCCPHRFHATSSDRGKAMKADWPTGPNQTRRKSKWTKMPGGSCVAPR